MLAVKHSGSPAPPPPRVARQLEVIPYAETVIDLRVPARTDGPRPHSVAARPAAVGPWAQYIAIGLGPKLAVPRGPAARVAVSLYRLLGFVLLAVIVVGLLGYLATSLFYVVNRTWIVPAVISPTDERVLALQTELSTYQTQRDRVAAELADAERAVAAEQAFQRELAAAIKLDLAGRQAALDRVRTLATNTASTRKSVQRTNRAFSVHQSARLAREYRAGLVDRRRMLDGKHQLAQVSTETLSLTERQADLDTRAAELTVEVAGLTAIVSEQHDAPVSYDALTIKRSCDASKLALAKALDTRALLDASLHRYNQLIANLEQPAYLRTVRDQTTLAAVPYDNAAAASKGAPVYACRATMIVCRRIGRVSAVLPGEVTVQHPHRDRSLRGRLVELELVEPAAARSDVLFVGGAPLWF